MSLGGSGESWYQPRVWRLSGLQQQRQQHRSDIPLFNLDSSNTFAFLPNASFDLINQFTQSADKYGKQLQCLKLNSVNELRS